MIEDAVVIPDGDNELIDLAMERIDTTVKSLVGKILYRLYDRIEHGDEEHRKWLHGEILKYMSELGI